MIRGFLLFCLVNTSILGIGQNMDKYHEDLSKVRPIFSYEEIKDSLEKEQKVEAVRPVNNQNLEVDSVAKKLGETYKNYRYTTGYRIQVYSGTSEEDAIEAKKLVREEIEGFEDVALYVTYKSPNFRVKVGDYLDRLEAYKVYQELKKHFKGALMISEKIEVAKLRDEH